MHLRIISGKLRPGTWAAFEHAYRQAISDAGPIEGLCGRWLTRDIDDPDAGTTISLWATESAMDAYENSDSLKNKINPQLEPFFSGEYRTTKSCVQYAEGSPAPNQWLDSGT